jgi:sRNA-binding carbon storage regulator CsrA
MLQLKIRPGHRITIGDDVVMDVVLDDDRKLALRISAPSEQKIARVAAPSNADGPQQTPADNQI